MEHIDAVIRDIQDYARVRSLSPRALALRAGLNKNTLSGIARHDWNPTVQTIRAIQGVMEQEA